MKDRHDNQFEEAAHKIAESICGLAGVVLQLTNEIHHQNDNKAILHRLAEMENRIMANQAQLQAQLVADLKLANAQLRKLLGDTAGIQPAVDALKAQIVELEALIEAGGAIGQELVDAVAETKSLAQQVDDNVPELAGTPDSAPVITTQPIDPSVVAGSDVAFSVVAAGAEPLSYQWQLNDVAIAGEIGATLKLGNVQAANAGDYTVTVTNPNGSVKSIVAKLTVT